MSDAQAPLPAPLQAIIDDFRDLSREEKLEYLLEFSEQLPALPAPLRASAPLERVDECATPVDIAFELRDGQIFFHFDIPPESPTVRGFAEILRQGLNGLAPKEIVRLPNDIYYRMGLQSALSPQRLNGVHFMVVHLKLVAARGLAQLGQ